MRGGEVAVKSGNDGELMMREFLRLVGWDNISQNESFFCNLGKKHKLASSESEKRGHNIDGVFHYDSPLKHSDLDIILCSSKHNQDAYSDKSKAYGHLKELAHSLECAPKDFAFFDRFENDKKQKRFKGVLFWVSSNREEQNVSMIERISSGLIADDEDTDDKLGKLRGIPYDSIYLVHNQKATFIFSAIKTAQEQAPTTQVQFLYPHTGLNNESEDLGGYGPIMPVQYINTSLLPLVIDENGTIKILIFCDGDFGKDSLKRIIWLAHKVSGVVSDVVIHFNDYDVTRDSSAVNDVKRIFQHSPTIGRISVSRIRHAEFTVLKEAVQLSTVVQKALPQANRLQEGPRISPSGEELDRVLPFGEMIKPIISSTILSDSDLKSFLIRKGIYIGNKEKQQTVPLLSTLLLSPTELNTLKFLLKAKEDRVKSVPRKTDLGSNKLNINQLAALLHEALQSSGSSYTLPENCTFQARPKVQIIDSEVVVGFGLEKRNSTKDLITGLQHNEGAIRFRLSDTALDNQIDYTSRETYAVGNKIFKILEGHLLEKEAIADEFSSIRFNSFDNFGRINFLLGFINMRSEQIFDDARLEHIVVKPDSSIDEEFPFDLESLKDKVNELAISGKGLDTVHYFQDDYKRILLIQKVRIRYSYKLGISKGHCLVELDFKNALRHGDEEAELQFNLEIVKNRTTRGQNLDRTTQDLVKAFNSIIQKKSKNRNNQ